MPFWLSPGPTASAYGLGVTSACWGAAAGIVQCRETSVSAMVGLVHRSKLRAAVPRMHGLVAGWVQTQSVAQVSVNASDIG